MKTWEARAAAYDRSFGKLCAGPIDRLLDDTGPGSLLDAGCGTGTLAARAETRGRTVTACDAEASMIGIARDRLRGPVRTSAVDRHTLSSDSWGDLGVFVLERGGVV